MSDNEAREYGKNFAETLAEWWDAYQNGRQIEEQDAYEFLSELPYDITLRKGAPFRVTLAGGGPSAWLEAELDTDGEPTRSALVVAWWSEPVRFTSPAIDGITALYAEQYAEQED